MKQSNKTRETVIRTEKRELDGIIYTYTLTVNVSEGVASYRLPLYSIKARMDDGEALCGEASVNDAFADVGKALVFFEKLVEYAVTPIDLPYVLEDEMRS